MIITDQPWDAIGYICRGDVRWVPLSSMQAHQRKLQQLFEIQHYKNGRVAEIIQEWRDVPFEDASTEEG